MGIMTVKRSGDESGPVIPPPAIVTVYEPKPVLYSAANVALVRQIGFKCEPFRHVDS